MEIWYDREAPYWEGALPLGNGKVGAMVYGGVARETLQLNEDTIWSGPGEYELDPNTPALVETARRLISEKKFFEATEFIRDNILLKRDECQCYQTAGFLYLDFDLPEGEVSDYRRSLSLEEGICRQSFSLNGVRFERESFISYPDRVMCMKIYSSVPGAVAFTTTFESPMPCFTPYSIDGAAEIAFI